MKGLAIRNTHVKYESPSTYKSKVMSKVKVFEKVKLQGQRVKVMV
jgi:DNA-binding transcriptional regulator of glucitol operon